MYRRIVVLVLALGVTASLRAQTANVPDAEAQKAISGTWSSVWTVPDHPAWTVEDSFCHLGARAVSFCPPSTRQHLRAWLANPANDSRPLPELMKEANQGRNDFLQRLMTDAARERRSRYDPSADPECGPPNLINLVVGALPVAIEARDSGVIFRYDGSSTVRTIRMSRQAAPAVDRSTLLGSATARWEGSSLIVESRNVAGVTSRFLTTSDGTRVVERYTASGDGTRLELELTIDDPASFREPLVLVHARVRTPEVTLLDPLPCEASQ